MRFNEWCGDNTNGFTTAMEKSTSFEETEVELSFFLLSMLIYFVGFKYTVKE